MTAIDDMSLIEIQSKGLEMLSRELGPVGLIRFLQQFDSGLGDYTAERSTWLGTPHVSEIVRNIREQRLKPESNTGNIS